MATNLILFAGKDWNFDLEWLLDNFPTDPLENCGAAWHPYEFKCKDFDCNANVSGPLTAKYVYLMYSLWLSHGAAMRV
jgi:hypothetical protein